MDFMNVHRVAQGLVPQEHITVDGMVFHVSRKMEGNQVVKTIAFEADGRHHLHEEKVQALEVDDFLRYFRESGLETERIMGSASGQAFDPQHSPRLILIARKP